MASHPHTQELTKTLHSANLVLVSVQFVTFRTLRTGLFQVVTEVLAAVIFSKCFWDSFLYQIYAQHITPWISNSRMRSQRTKSYKPQETFEYNTLYSSLFVWIHVTAV
jgi:hypothetical protein